MGTVTSNDTDIRRAHLLFLDAPIEVTCQHSDLTWLTEFLHPHLKSANIAGDDLWSVKVTKKSHTGSSATSLETVETFTLDGSFCCLPAGPDTQGALELSDAELGVTYRIDARNITVFSARRPSQARLALLRIVREIGTAHALVDGAAPVHAAALDLQGKGVLLVGDKRSGKTSLLLHLLRADGASLVANDRSLLDDIEGAWRVRGVATIAKLRPGVLELRPDLAARFRHAPLRYKWTLAECQDRSAAEILGTARQPELSGPQLAALTDVQLTPDSTLTAVVFPQLEPSVETWELVRLAPAEFADKLYRNLLRPGSAVAIATAFRQHDDPSPADLENSLRRLCISVANAVPGFDCKLGPHAYAEPAAASELAAEVTDS